MPDKLLDESFGIPKSLLSQVTSSPSDVRSGKKFIDSNGIIQSGTLVAGRKLLAYHVDWSLGGSFCVVLDTTKLTKLSEGDGGEQNVINTVRFNAAGNYYIYAYASASNDNQNGYVALGGTRLVDAHINNRLTQKYEGSRYVNNGAVMQICNGGYSGATSFLICEDM